MSYQEEMMANPYSKRTRFRFVDTTWLHMGTTPTQTTIGGLLLLDEPLTLAQLKTLVRARLLRFRKFRQRVREPNVWFFGPTWEDDPLFDIDTHVHSSSLDDPESWASLRAFFEDLMGIPLDPTQPLWQIHLVEKYGQGSALIIHLEHAVADGVALMHVLDTISDLSPTTDGFEPAPESDDSRLMAAFDTMFSMGEVAVKTLQALPAEGIRQARNPRQLGEQGVAAAKALGKLVFASPDPQTILRGKCSTAHRVAFSEPLALNEVKAVGKALGGTINDVILSAVAGGFRRYLMARGEFVQGLEFRGIVPVNLRSSPHSPDLGNEFGIAFLSLPVGTADPVARLQELKGRMDGIKETPEAWVSYAILQSLGMMPRSIEQILVKFFCMKATTTMTNVAGPAETRYLAGSRIDRIMFSVPHPAGAATGMSIMSYDGTIMVTIDTDAHIIPHPDDIIEGFHAEYALLQESAANAQAEIPPKTSLAGKDGQRTEPVADAVADVVLA